MKNVSKKQQKSVLFLIGGLGYGLLEILWRGRTHWSMVLAGGLCFCFFEWLSRGYHKAGLWLKSLYGCAFVTGIEFLFGVLFNMILKRNVWDYSDMPLNIAGQVCLLFSFFWYLLSLLFIPLAGWTAKRLSGQSRINPRMTKKEERI